MTQLPAGFTVRLTLEYDGSDYCGWQFQPSVPTVEGALRTAMERLTGEQARFTASGRTDGGAHAHGQVVGCTLSRRWDVDTLRLGLNALLPHDIVVLEVRPAAAAFHARFQAVARTYRYVVVPRTDRLAVSRQYAWRVRGPLDLDAMRHAAGLLVGRHDFCGFGRSPRDGGSTLRTVQRVAVRRTTLIADRQDRAGAVIIEVVADAFLYGMMRSIAGLLVAVGQGRLADGDVSALLSAPHSVPRPAVAPAHGLHQWTVIYPDAGTQAGRQDEEEA